MYKYITLSPYFRVLLLFTLPYLWLSHFQPWEILSRTPSLLSLEKQFQILGKPNNLILYAFRSSLCYFTSVGIWANYLTPLYIGSTFCQIGGDK